MSDNMAVSFICINTLLFGFYYLNSEVLIPKLFKARRWFLYTASIVACFLIFLFAPKPIANAIAEPEDAVSFYTSRNLPVPPDAKERYEARKNITHYRSSYLGFVLMFAIGLAVMAIQEWFKSEETKKTIEHEKLNTELSLLKSQLNPHFFFNTLNNIYSLAIVKSDETASSILKLSAIMRYVLTEAEESRVPLAREIEFLENYIQLQSVRLTDKVKLDVAICKEAESKEIAPLLFIPFVENAFKYGVSTVEPSQITIKLTNSLDKIKLFVQNSIIKSVNHNGNNTEIGIVNVKRRLELLYPNKHQLTINHNKDQYTVNLEIDFE
jgi:two-component system LytT family sensor kinase